ncbi:MAG: UDP-glucose 4-epimerase GalE [Lachnospirales bacterium]
MKVLFVGGAGYLGRNICYALSDNNIEAVVVDTVEGTDSFSLPGCFFYRADITDRNAMKKILDEHKDIEICINNAMISAVANSVKHPYDFYQQNVSKTLEFFHLLKERGIKKVIYSSTASVYDDVRGYMVTERSPLKPRSPFGRSKYIMEMILKDFCNAYDMKCITLRYFNPIGADPETRRDLPYKAGSNLLETLVKLLINGKGKFTIMGDDWDTRDGTCIRDYIHVRDLAMANAKAVLNFDEAFERAGIEYTNYLSLNIGSGVDVTVKEFLIAFENVTGEKINTVVGDRRQGDIGGSYANIGLAKRTIGWTPQYTIEDAIFDVLKYYDI